MRHKKSVLLPLAFVAAPPPAVAAPTPAAPGGRAAASNARASNARAPVLSASVTSPLSSPPLSSPLTSARRRYLVAALPCFRLERCGWGAEELVVLVDEEKSALRVQVASRAAAREGLRPGMTVSEARALCPGVQVELADPAELELADLLSLLSTLERLSPQLRAVPPQALALELPRRRGADEGALLKRLLEHLSELGHACQLAVADDVEAALVLAGWWMPDVEARHRVVPPGGLAQALAPLPLAALAPSPSLSDRLTLLGVRQVAELAALDPASVAGRFGAEGLRLHRLARGVPASAPIEPVTDPSGLCLRQQLLDPIISLEGVLIGLEGLCGGLCEALAAQEQAAVRLQVRLGVEGAADFLMPLRLGQPRRQPDAIMRLLRQRLEGVQLGGAVTDLSLSVLESAPFLGQQQGLLDRSGAQEPLPELLARLADTLGPERVYAPALEPSHRPEGAWSAQAADASVFRKADGQALPEASRPPLLLREPRPIRARLGPDLRPRAVEVDGEHRPIRELEGPERLRGAWWAPDPFDRDYYRVELEDGRAFWVFLDNEGGEWWLHGVWG